MAIDSYDTIALPWNQNVETAPGAASTWSGTQFTWSDVLSVELALAMGATDPSFDNWFHNWQNKNEEKKKRFIMLMTEIEGKEYFKKRELKDGKIMLTAKDVNILADHMRKSGIELRVKNIEIL